MRTEILQNSPADLDRACELLSRDEVVALPTETVYGLAGNAFSSNAVLKIFAAKERPSFDPLIVHVSGAVLGHPKGPLEALIEQGVLSPGLRESSMGGAIARAMMRFWPGPLTLVLPKGPKIPGEVSSGLATVGIRMPAHPVFQRVLERVGFPLAAPSANRFGRISPTTANHAKTELDGRISAIVDGGSCAVGVESTILKIEEGALTILRPGKIGHEELERFFGIPVGVKKGLMEQESPVAPGLLDQHYAPRKALYLLPGEAKSLAEAEAFARSLGAQGRAGALLQRDLSGTGSLEEAARRLFSELRRLDEDPFVDFIVADLPERVDSGLGAAIADRLNRASGNKPLGGRDP